MEVKKVLNVEFKYFQYYAVQSDMDCSGAFINLFSPAQDDAVNGRNGDSCRVKRIVINAFVKAGTADSVFRVWLLHCPDGTGPSSLSDFLDLTSATDPRSIVSHKIYSERKNFRILKEFVGCVAAYMPAKAWKWNIPLNQHVIFDAGATTISENAFLLVYASDRAAADSSAQKPDITFASRVYYVDN